MRNIGDLQWLNDWIGIPYLFAGRDAAGTDCYGLIKLVYQYQYGVVLPDWLTDELDFKGRHNAIDSVVTSGCFTEKDAPADGDIVVAYRTRAAHHLGLYYGGGILHCSNGSGTVYEPESRFAEKFVRVVYGSWEP
jgi:cell wall-associated NlpC family hydrolase